MTDRGYESPGPPAPAIGGPPPGGELQEDPKAFLERLEAMARAGVRFVSAVDAATLDALAAGCARGAAAHDLALGEGLDLLARTGGHVRLGYSGVGDLARERLGLPADQARRLRRIAERLRSRPLLRGAVVKGEVTLRKAEVVASEAVGAEEAYWVARARVDTVRRLEAAVRSGPADAEEDWHRLRIGLTLEGTKVLDVAMDVAEVLVGPTAPPWRRFSVIAMEFLSSSMRASGVLARRGPRPSRHPALCLRAARAVERGLPLRGPPPPRRARLERPDHRHGARRALLRPRRAGGGRGTDVKSIGGTSRTVTGAAPSAARAT
jgi:hypothetical protein